MVVQIMAGCVDAARERVNRCGWVWNVDGSGINEERRCVGVKRGLRC